MFSPAEKRTLLLACAEFVAGPAAKEVVGVVHDRLNADLRTRAEKIVDALVQDPRLSGAIERLLPTMRPQLVPALAGILAAHGATAEDLAGPACGFDHRRAADLVVERAGERLAQLDPQAAATLADSILPAFYDALTLRITTDADLQRALFQRLLVDMQATLLRIGRLEQADHVPLLLDRRHRLQVEITSDADLLLASSRVTELIGRDVQIGRLLDWLGDAVKISLHAIHGPAGSGKTRLAIELCERAERLGWLAGFAHADNLRCFAEHHEAGAWIWPRPTLIVVDYAARSARVLNGWLHALARHASPAPPLRFLLLERNGEAEGGWWSELRSLDGEDRRLLRLFTATGRPEPLSTVRSTDDRRRILAQTLSAWARHNPDGHPPALPPPGADPRFDEALAADSIDREPLHLMMAALFALQHGFTAALGLTRLDLALWRAIVERDRLDKLARTSGIAPKLLVHLVARITLCRGVAPDTLDALVIEERKALHIEHGAAPQDVVPALRTALPPAPTRPRPEDGPLTGFIEPDIIGEAFCLLVLTGSCPTTSQQQALIGRIAATGAIRRTAQQLVLAIQDFARELPASPTRQALTRDYPEFARLPAWLERNNPALAWLEALITATESVTALIELANQLPPSTLLMRQAGEIVQRSIADRLRPMAAESPDTFLPDLASALNNLGNRLSALGRREAALEATEEAVAIRRRLAHDRPDAFLPDLASALNNLSVDLSNLGRREPALEATEEAVASYRRLAHDRPDAFLPDLAVSLAARAQVLAAMERTEAALAGVAEAISALRPTFLVHPAAVAHWMVPMCQMYLDYCEKLGVEPDGELLGPIVAVLQRLQTAEDSSSS